ncbi:MAG: hypothetical protein ABSE73_11795 [Planctomycetota bacterium]
MPLPDKNETPDGGMLVTFKVGRETRRRLNGVCARTGRPIEEVMELVVEGALWHLCREERELCQPQE